jgi:hypothetical protein
MASPRWRFSGHGSRSRSDEKVEMTRVAARAGWARAAGAHRHFLPWLRLMRGGLESSVDQLLNLDQSGSRVRTHRRAPFPVLRYFENQIIEMQLLSKDVA